MKMKNKKKSHQMAPVEFCKIAVVLYLYSA